MPEPWAAILAALTGPFGVVVAEGVVIFFLWRLFREAAGEARTAMAHTAELTQAVKDLTTVVRAWRERP